MRCKSHLDEVCALGSGKDQVLAARSTRDEVGTLGSNGNEVRAVGSDVMEVGIARRRFGKGRGGLEGHGIEQGEVRMVGSPKGRSNGLD